MHPQDTRVRYLSCCPPLPRIRRGRLIQHPSQRTGAFLTSLFFQDTLKLTLAIHICSPLPPPPIRQHIFRHNCRRALCHLLLLSLLIFVSTDEKLPWNRKKNSTSYSSYAYPGAVAPPAQHREADQDGQNRYFKLWKHIHARHTRAIIRYCFERTNAA